VTNTMQTTWECTADAPCWIVGRADDRPVFTGENNTEYPGDGRIILTNSSYVFVDGLEFTHKHAGAVQVDNSGSGISHHISVRNCYAHDYDFSSAGSAFGFSARDQGTTYDCVMYHNTCERLGDSHPPAGQDPDLHCTTFSLRNGNQYDAEGYRFFWLENEANDGGGSGIQVNGWPGGQTHLHHMYLGKNIGHGNRQRMIGIKQSSHVIVSQNNYTNYGENSGVNEIFGWALSPDYVWFIFNTIHDATDGWRASDSSGGEQENSRIYMVGNKIFDIKYNSRLQQSDPYNPPNEWRYGQVVDGRARAQVYSVDNSIYSSLGGWKFHDANSLVKIYGNIVSDIHNQDAFIALQANMVPHPTSDSDYNLFYDPTSSEMNWIEGSVNYHTLAGWQGATGYDTHSIVNNPNYINPTLDVNTCDLRLQTGSPAINSNNSPRDLYNLFQSLYGIDIRVDFEGNKRPQGTGWDMGAFEYNEPEVGPIRSNGTPVGIQPQGTTSVTLSITTNVSATCKYSTVANINYDNMTNIMSGNSTTHTVIINNLIDSNYYTYYIRCNDGSHSNQNDYAISFSVAPVGATCGAGHSELCTSESSCNYAHGTWCTDHCQNSSSCPETEIRADVDQNSTINSTDAMLTLRNSLGLDMSGTNWVTGTHTGDVNCDNSSNSTDAMLILRKSLGLDMSGTGWCGN